MGTVGASVSGLWSFVSVSACSRFGGILRLGIETLVRKKTDSGIWTAATSSLGRYNSPLGAFYFTGGGGLEERFVTVGFSIVRCYMTCLICFLCVSFFFSISLVLSSFLSAPVYTLFYSSYVFSLSSSRGLSFSFYHRLCFGIWSLFAPVIKSGVSRSRAASTTALPIIPVSPTCFVILFTRIGTVIIPLHSITLPAYTCSSKRLVNLLEHPTLVLIPCLSLLLSCRLLALPSCCCYCSRSDDSHESRR